MNEEIYYEIKSVAKDIPKKEKKRFEGFLLGRTGGSKHGTCVEVLQNLVFIDESGVIVDVWKI